MRMHCDFTGREETALRDPHAALELIRAHRGQPQVVQTIRNHFTQTLRPAGNGERLLFRPHHHRVEDVRVIGVVEQAEHGDELIESGQRQSDHVAKMPTVVLERFENLHAFDLDVGIAVHVGVLVECHHIVRPQHAFQEGHAALGDFLETVEMGGRMNGDNVRLRQCDRAQIEISKDLCVVVRVFGR